MSGVAKIDKLINHFQSFEERLDSIIRQAIEENESAIIDFNIYEQLYNSGITRYGETIVPEYSEETIRIKQDLGQPTNRVTLRDTGDFHESFYIDYGIDDFVISSSDKKTPKLRKKYGKEIFGLTEANWSKVIKQFIEPLIEYELKTIK